MDKPVTWLELGHILSPIGYGFVSMDILFFGPRPTSLSAVGLGFLVCAVACFVRGRFWRRLRPQAREE